MSNQVAGAVAGRVRPPTVAAAVVALWVVAAGLAIRGLLGGVLAFGYHAISGSGVDVDVSPDLVDLIIRLTGIVLVVGFGLVTLGMLLTSLFVRRGSNPARITAWVLAGLTLLCCGCGGLSDLVSQATGDLSTPAATGTGVQLPPGPGWLAYTDGGVALGTALFALLGIVLLAVPASNDYFRRLPQGWVPPGYGGGPASYAQPPQYPYAQPPQYPYAQPPQYPQPPVPPPGDNRPPSEPPRQG